jgi:ABC-2 type transport system permease protein
MSGDTAATGVIHDIGYRQYEGKRYGNSGITWALYIHSLRSAFGLGRGAKAKIVPIVAFILMCLPAVVNAVAVANGGAQNQNVFYDTYTPTLRALIVTVFVAVQAPELVSGDRRYRVLQLYFSRPMRRTTYPLAKLLAFTTACLLLIEIPLLLLYVGTVSSVHGGHQVWLQTKALIPGLGMGALWAVLLASVALLLASFAARRAYATGTVAAVLFATFVISHILIRATEKVVQVPVTSKFEAPPGAPLPPGIHNGQVIHGFMTQLEPTTASKLVGLVSPYSMLDAIRQWIGGISHPTDVPPPGSYGWAFLAGFLLLLVASAGGLFLRYRKVGLS